MNLNEAKDRLQRASNLLFSVEVEMMDSEIRRIGYRARCLIGEFKHLIQESCDKEDISKLNE